MHKQHWTSNPIAAHVPEVPFGIYAKNTEDALVIAVAVMQARLDTFGHDPQILAAMATLQMICQQRGGAEVSQPDLLTDYIDEVVFG